MRLQFVMVLGSYAKNTKGQVSGPNFKKIQVPKSSISLGLENLSAGYLMLGSL